MTKFTQIMRDFTCKLLSHEGELKEITAESQTEVKEIMKALTEIMKEFKEP